MYKKAAEFMPSYTFNEYYYYKKAGLWSSAANALTNYVLYCKEKDIGSAEYWEDETEKITRATKVRK